MVVWRTRKAKSPARYDETQKNSVSFAIRLLLATKLVDFGRQSKISQAPNSNAGTERKECTNGTVKFTGELRYNEKELLSNGDINSTKEKLKNAAAITAVIVTACTR
jgi:hypothetical protein